MSAEQKQQSFRRGQVRGRIYVEPTGSYGDWRVVDALDGGLIDCDTRRQAEDMARFAREYIRRHGDIDFQRFPCDLDHELVYQELTRRPWAIVDMPVTVGSHYRTAMGELWEVTRADSGCAMVALREISSGRSTLEVPVAELLRDWTKVAK